MTPFVEKIVDLHRRFDAGAVPHAFGGAIALGYHIESPRATADIDVNILMPPASAVSTFATLPPGVAWDEADAAAVRRDAQVRLFWDRTPVDLFFPQHELHDVMAGRVETVPFAGSEIPILSATDLAIFKALFNRPRDWVDIGAMAEYGSLDPAEVRPWLIRLLGGRDERVARLDGLAKGR